MENGLKFLILKSQKIVAGLRTRQENGLIQIQMRLSHGTARSIVAPRRMKARVRYSRALHLSNQRHLSRRTIRGLTTELRQSLSHSQQRLLHPAQHRTILILTPTAHRTTIPIQTHSQIREQTTSQTTNQTIRRITSLNILDRKT